MSEVETVTHEGKVYQIGGIYEFSDGGDQYHLDVLESINCGDTYPFNVHCDRWKLIRAVNSTIGTITPAPIELVNGNAYMFDYHGNRKAIVGVYNQEEESFLTRMGILRPWNATNIRLMTVGSE